MKFASTGVAAAAMIAFGAFGVTAAHTGVLAPHASADAAKLPATFQMYANVDQLGDLGSNVGAKSAKDYEDINYTVTFTQPIGTCAAQVQPGYAGGNLVAGYYASLVTYAGPKSFDVRFLNTATGLFTPSAFMMTVTCKS